MTILISENFETFGDDTSLMLDGIWADIGTGTELAIPAFDTEGRYWIRFPGLPLAGVRRVTGAGIAGIGAFVRPYLEALPGAANRVYLAQVRDTNNDPILTLRVQPDGNILAYNFAGTLVAQTTDPAIRAGTLHDVKFQAVFHATLGTVEVRVDGVAVITATNLVLTGSATQVYFGNSGTGATGHSDWYIKDLAVWSLTGTYNDDWPLITGVLTLYPDADTADAGFTPRPRQIIDAGVLIVPGSGSLLDCAASSTYNLSSGDFTIDLRYRPVEPVTGSVEATILGKWSASTSNRSYRLVQYGPDVNNGELRWECTTDGTLATLVTVAAYRYSFEVGYTYTLGLERESGQFRLYVNGAQVGLDQPDANTYFNASTNAKFTVGGEMSGVGTTVLTNSSVNAIFDEVRVTPGVARYSANYSPPSTPYPRSAPSDPNFASVVLLAGFDESVADESSVGQTLTLRGTAARLVPADGTYDYQTIDATVPLDDRYLEAALVSATGIFTLEAVPANATTVTLGAQTYTFNTVLGAADSILIGADEAACIDNLVAAINGGAGEGTLYGTGTVANASATAEAAPTSVQLTATAITPGAAGNAIASTETVTGGSWTAATLTGGADIPGISRFGLQTLPPTVTGVRAIEVRNRSYVDNGAATLQMRFQVNAADALGADNALTANPTSRFDIFEEDPNTTGALTPTSVNTGSIVLDRNT